MGDISIVCVREGRTYVVLAMPEEDRYKMRWSISELKGLERDVNSPPTHFKMSSVKVMWGQRFQINYFTIILLDIISYYFLLY